jgi:hypothetical protein
MDSHRTEAVVLRRLIPAAELEKNKDFSKTHLKWVCILKKWQVLEPRFFFIFNIFLSWLSGM